MKHSFKDKSVTKLELGNERQTGRRSMIPENGECLSFLMGAVAITDEELNRLGIRIAQGAGTAFRGLIIPSASLEAYKALVREKITAGFWNDIVGRGEISFLFKLKDGTIEEFVYSEANRERIARLCTCLNNDPIEKTSGLLRYLAANPFYREAMAAFHNVDVHSSER
jgi:hypothetical protein